jgi:hypothetical protein
MDPATLGLLISIASTALDLLFGQGHHTLNVQDVQEKLRQMYGYGLEGYGYRYPELTEEALVPIVTIPGSTIKKYIKVPSKQWVVAYYLNKKLVEKIHG